MQFALWGLLGLVLALALHEFGHLVAARYFKVNPRSVSIGFGPTLFFFSDRFGTKWRIQSVPLGGYVQISRNELLRSTTPLQRGVIYAAGSAMNVLAGAATLYLMGPLWPDSLLDISNAFHTAATMVVVFGAASLLLGVLQLIPLFPHDGAWLVVTAVEALTGNNLSGPRFERVVRCGTAATLVVYGGVIAGVVYLTLGHADILEG